MSAWKVADDALTELGERIVADSEGAASGFSVRFGELTVVGPAHRIVGLLKLLRDNANYQFIQLIDLAGADYPQRERRFDIVYHLLSYTKNRRLRIKVETDEDTPAPSVVSVHPCADWFEREAFDMYGIFFEGHPDLRRILTDYGFHGHPMRKDFPMTGYVEVRYDDELKRVVYEPVKSVEWRNWDFLSPWEGAEYARPGQGYPYQLPGDEKAGEGA
ncbi:MAG TPA: NADH-quinone oxidoreductase subunit C [Caulobacteraceae bacterium]|nr:NADH-quinone oxidoreductase subunit C [Caulobacteraceae bacterium]